MQIQKGNFTWRSPLTPLDLTKVDSIGLHHMAHLTADEYEVERWHKARENGTWKGIGYNYWIGFDGRIVEGRGLNEGAGVLNNNGHIISIGFQGNYDIIKEMPKSQYDAGIWLIQFLKQKVPSIKIVDGHKKWNPTSCPGKYFPLEEMVKGINTVSTTKPSSSNIMPLIKEGSISETVKFLQIQLERKGIKIVQDGIFGIQTKKAVKEYQSKNGLVVDGIVGQNTWKSLLGGL